MSRRILLLLLCAVLTLGLLAACGSSEDRDPETLPAADIQETEAPAPYGILQELVDSYGFPFQLRYTEGMGIVCFDIYEDHADREWHHSLDGNSEYKNLTWVLSGDTLKITGEWEESFTLDMEKGTATSLTDGVEYRLVVYENGGDISHGYVE